MENITEFEVKQVKRPITEQDLISRPASRTRCGSAAEILISEGSENFCNYVEWLGLTNDPGMVVLSSLHHYYYDHEEMRNFKTVISLKELNMIKDIKGFLYSCLNYLPQNSNFIGCFIDHKKFNGYNLRNNSSPKENYKNSENVENGIVSRIPFINMLYSLMDSKTNTYMSKQTISALLEEFGFRIKDMSEINGLTFLHSVKIRELLN